MAPIYILRHAEKEKGGFYNPRLRHQDEPISAQGRLQAAALSTYFIAQPISAIFVSEYQRTAQTIAPTAASLGLTPVVDVRLNEFDNGCLDGMSDAEVQQAYPEVWHAYRERKADFRFPQGETGAEVLQRAAAFLNEKRDVNETGSIIAVCHDGLIRVLMCHIVGLPVYCRWNFRVDFCGITEVVYQPEYDSWKLLRFNHTLPVPD